MNWPFSLVRWNANIEFWCHLQLITSSSAGTCGKCRWNFFLSTIAQRFSLGRRWCCVIGFAATRFCGWIDAGVRWQIAWYVWVGCCQQRMWFWICIHIRCVDCMHRLRFVCHGCRRKWIGMCASTCVRHHICTRYGRHWCTPMMIRSSVATENH